MCSFPMLAFCYCIYLLILFQVQCIFKEQRLKLGFAINMRTHSLFVDIFLNWKLNLFQVHEDNKHKTEFVVFCLLCITAHSLMMLIVFLWKHPAIRQSCWHSQWNQFFLMSGNLMKEPFVIASSEFYIRFSLITDLSGWRCSQFKDGLLCCWNALISGCVFLTVLMWVGLHF